MKNILKGSTVLLLCLMAVYIFQSIDQNSRMLPPTSIASKPTEAKKGQIWRDAKFGKVDPSTLRKSRKSFDEKFQQQSKAKSRDGGVNSWTEMGPKGIGGRMIAFVIDPNNDNHIIGATETGGLWETFNQGGNWTLKDDFMESLVISDIEYDPFDDSVIYASTGNNRGSTFINMPGSGLLKSTDNGASWSLVVPTTTASNFNYMTNIALDSDNSGTIYATTVPTVAFGPNQGSLIKSTDGGDNWQFVGLLPSSPNNIYIDPFDSDNILIACDNHLVGSFDAESSNMTLTQLSLGGSGNLPSNAGRVEVAYAPASNGKVYAVIQNTGSATNLLYESSNSGMTWSPISSNDIGNDANRSHAIIWVSAFNSNTIILGGVDLHRSIDGGMNFDKISDWSEDIGGGGNSSIHADHFMIKPDNGYNGGFNRKVFISNDGGLYSTNDIRTVSEYSGWISNVGNLANTQCYGGAADVADGKLIVGTQDNAFAISQNSGATWAQPSTGDGSRAAIDPTDSDIMYVNLNYNTLQKSTDGGSSWSTVARFGYSQDPNASFPGSWPSCAMNSSCTSAGQFWADDFAFLISPFIIDPNDENNILAGGTSLWKNTNKANASDWTMIKDTLPDRSRIFEIAVANNDSDNIWVSYVNGVVERTLNNGSTWSGDISPTTSSISDPTSITINPNNSSQVIVSYNSFFGNNLFYTSNGNSSNPTWTNISTDINVAISTVAWHPTNSNWIYAGTAFGILASENKGSTWSITPLYSGSEGPVNTEISQLFFVDDNTPILSAITYGRGMWLSNLLLDKVYVDKNFTGPIGLGTLALPYKNFKTAYENAGNGAEIIFLSGGTYDDLSSTLIMEKRLTITGLNLSSNATIE